MTEINNPQAITVHKGVHERVSINIIYKFKEFNDINKNLESDSILHPDAICFIDLGGLFTLVKPKVVDLGWRLLWASISSFDQFIIPVWDLMTIFIALTQVPLLFGDIFGSGQLPSSLLKGPISLSQLFGCICQDQMTLRWTCFRSCWCESMSRCVYIPLYYYNGFVIWIVIGRGKIYS